LKHHEELFHEQFKEYEAKKQKQQQPQRQEQVREDVSLEDKPTTAEATARAKAQGRRKPVLPEAEYAHAKIEPLTDELAEYNARPLCAKCGFKHYPDKACIQITETKRKR
jgi:hypothetical protein